VVCDGAPQKANLTGIAAANNDDEVYLAVARSANDGAVGFSFIFTREGV
jgi:hypothetical protein